MVLKNRNSRNKNYKKLKRSMYGLLNWLGIAKKKLIIWEDGLEKITQNVKLKKKIENTNERMRGMNNRMRKTVMSM